MNLLRPHLSNLKRKRTSSGQPLETPSVLTRIGVFGFGVSFALLALLQRIVGLPTTGLQNPWSPEIITFWVLAYPLAGALGGAMFGSAIGSRGRSAFFTLGGALVFFIGPRAESYIAMNVDPSTPFSTVLVFMIEPALIGTLVGILVGLTQENWLGVVYFALVGALGFTFGRMVGFVVAAGLFWATSHTNLWATNTASWLLVNLTDVVGGTIGGAILAKAAWRAKSNGFSPPTSKQ